MFSSSPPPYPGNDAPSDDVTLKDNTIVPEKNKEPTVTSSTSGGSASAIPSTNAPIEMTAMNPTAANPSQAIPNTPLKYDTAPNTPLPTQLHQPTPYPGIQPGMNMGAPGAPGVACISPPTVQPGMAYATGPGVMPAYAPAMPMQQMFTAPTAMPMNPMSMPAAMGNNASQAGGINLVVNTNANANSNSDSKNGAGGSQKPAPRPCPKCRLGYITRGQARFREMCIKTLAYATICCTCLLPLQLLKTNYVDKCSYCGEEYGFRGELFEKPKPPKM